MRLSQLLISDQRFPLYGYLQGSKWDSECRSGCLHVKFSYCCQRSWILKEERSEKRKRGSYCCYFVFVWHEWKSLHSFIFVIENRKTQNRCSWTRDYILPAAYVTHNAAWLLIILEKVNHSEHEAWSFILISLVLSSCQSSDTEMSKTLTSSFKADAVSKKFSTCTNLKSGHLHKSKI